MLTGLSVRDFVLIERLNLEFDMGLCVLTGETGAGKSILFDALGLCLGNRASSGLVRSGARQADVTAVFNVPSRHEARQLLQEQGLADAEDTILRRVVTADGRSKAFVNDRPVSATFLRDLGLTLVEVQGQHDHTELLDSANHRSLLDQYAGLEDDAAATATAFETMRTAERTWHDAESELERARADEAYLRHVVDELEALDPQPEEEETLASERSVLMHAEKLAESISEAQAALTPEDGAQSTLRRAERSLERSLEKAAGRFDDAVSALERASVEASEAVSVLEQLARQMTGDPGRLAAVEERLFSLRALARKHQTVVAELPEVWQGFAERLAVVNSGAGELTRLADQAAASREAYITAATSLSDKRHAHASAFDDAVNAELPPLKLGDALVQTTSEVLPEERWSSGRYRPRCLSGNHGTGPVDGSPIASRVRWRT